MTGIAAGSVKCTVAEGLNGLGETETIWKGIGTRSGSASVTMPISTGMVIGLLVALETMVTVAVSGPATVGVTHTMIIVVSQGASV